MSLGRDKVHDIALLARVHVTELELDEVTENLSRIIEFVEQLQRVDTTDIEPMSHPLGDIEQRLRDDVVVHEDRRERFQSDAPQVEDGLYLVPKVIE